MMLLLDDGSIGLLALAIGKEFGFNFGIGLEKCHLDEDSVVAGGNKNIYVFSRDGHTARTLANGKLLGKVELYAETNIIAPFGERLLCCIDSCSVAMIAPHGGMRVVCHTSSRISSMTGDPLFKILVIATIDRTVHIFNSSSGALVRSVPIGGDPRMMLITPVWGYILVLINNVVMILNVNGLVLKEFDIKQVIVYWFAFSWYSDFDFVVFATAAGTMGIFDAFHPEESREFHEFKDKISNIHIDMETGSFVVMSENGTMNVLPHPKIH